jgi:hypothetical protein
LGRAALRSHPNAHKPQRIDTAAGEAEALGDQSLVGRRKLALICSQKCPGNVILKTYDFARLVRDYSGTAIVSGFHSPIEKDCLPILLRGPSFVIIVQAHRLSTSRLPRDWQRAIDTGRLLLPSPFTEKHKRVTAPLATKRNRFVAAISDEVLNIYALAPGRPKPLSAVRMVRMLCSRIRTTALLPVLNSSTTECAELYSGRLGFAAYRRIMQLLKSNKVTGLEAASDEHSHDECPVTEVYRITQLRRSDLT